MNAVDRARSLLNSGDWDAAIAVVTDAVEMGDSSALNELARWHVFGHPVSRDFVLARKLFERAGCMGHRPAALTHAVFAAIGAGGTRDWQEAVGLLETAAVDDPHASRQVDLLKAMDLDAQGAPMVRPLPESVSRSPKICIIRRLFSPEECIHVATLGRPLLVPSIVVDPDSGRESPHPIRTSSGAVLGPVQMDLVIEALNRRIAAASATRVEQGEPLAVLHYSAGQQYRLHHDCLPGEENQREMTLIVYLNEDFDGGETYFPSANVRIRGRTGDAILFKNTWTDGSPDERSRHAGLPVTQGDKWICTRWIRSRDFDPWGMRNAGTIKA